MDLFATPESGELKSLEADLPECHIRKAPSPSTERNDTDGLQEGCWAR